MLGLFDSRPSHWWRKPSDCHVLPTVKNGAGSDHHSMNQGPLRYPRRYRRFITFAILVGILFTLLRRSGRSELDRFDLLSDEVRYDGNGNRLPPLYERWHAQELALPQHNPDLPFPEGREGKYFWIPSHVHASGWGNALQEVLLNAHLSYVSGRAYVFDNYTWSRDLSQEYSEYNGKLIPSRVPLSALITGPAVGGPFPEGDPAPRSVRKEYFDQVCEHRVVFHGSEVTADLSPEATASQITQAWLDKLNSIEDRCVELDISSSQIYEIWVFGTKRVLDIWPALSQSPIVTGFAWSPLIHSAFEANKYLLGYKESALGAVMSYVPFLPRSSWSSSNDQNTPIPGLLALHIRRGDFQDHCEHLAKWSSQFNGFNSFPSLPDKFEPPLGGGWGTTTPENRALYLKRCFPTVEQIVEKVESIRETESGKGLKNVFVMTNAKAEFLEELKEALKKGAAERGRSWEGVHGSRDLTLTWEQKYVAQSVDMLIGQKAQVFVGNGFSSLSSNIVMFRMLNDFAPESSRMW